MTTTEIDIECVSCGRKIDSNAKLCVYCNANPATGEKYDPAPIIESHFPKKKHVPLPERTLDFFRHRQGIVIALVLSFLVLALMGVHRFIMNRNDDPSLTQAPPIPLTEIADLSGQQSEPDLPMPKLEFQYAGNAKTFRTLVLEPGAIAPPTPPPGTPADPLAPTQLGQRLSTPVPDNPNPRPVPMLPIQNRGQQVQQDDRFLPPYSGLPSRTQPGMPPAPGTTSGGMVAPPTQSFPAPATDTTSTSTGTSDTSNTSTTTTTATSTENR